MKIGFSTNAFTNKSLIYAIESVARIGYDGIEIVLDEPHAFLPLELSQKVSLKKKITENNLIISNLNSNTVEGWDVNRNPTEKFEPSLSNKDKKLRDWRIDYTKKSIELAVELDAPSICITSGLRDTENEILLSNFKDSLFNLASFAEKKDIFIGIEYEPELLIETSDDVIAVINGFKNIGLNFDVCHAQVLGENIPYIIKKFKNKLFHIHLSDCMSRKHFHLIPGLGEIDFKEMFNALNEINYQGFVSVEIYAYKENPDYAAKEALTNIKKLVN